MSLYSLTINAGKDVEIKKIWRERMGVEPTRDIFMPHDGFEVRGAHRDPSAPLNADIVSIEQLIG